MYSVANGNRDVHSNDTAQPPPAATEGQVRTLAKDRPEVVLQVNSDSW